MGDSAWEEGYSELEDGEFALGVGVGVAEDEEALVAVRDEREPRLVLGNDAEVADGRLCDILLPFAPSSSSPHFLQGSPCL